MAIVQQIETIWSKASRSSKKAAIRNAVPENADAPAIPDKDNFHQHVLYDEKTNFEVPTTTINRFKKDRMNHYFGALRLFFEGRILKVIYTYSPEKVGAPARSTVPRQVLLLDEGEWGKVIYTGRFCRSYTGYGDWFYRKEVFNIANISDIPTHIFTETRPKKQFNDISNFR